MSGSKMMSVTIEVVFSVEVKTEPGETVCVVGNQRRLGNWDPHHALTLNRESSPRLARRNNEPGQSGHKRHSGDTWKRKVKFDGMEDLHYRYFVCKMKEADNEESDRIVNVIRWEANINPRIFSPKDYVLNSEKFDQQSTSLFGQYEERNFVNKGWLTDQSQIVIKLHSNPIEMWKPRYRTQMYRIKCTPIDYRYRDQGDEEEEEESRYPTHTVPPSTFSKVSVSVLRDDLCTPRVQNNTGQLYHKDDYMIFTAQSTDPECLGFQIDLFVESDNTEPRHVGYCYLLPMAITQSNDMKTIPITGLKHKPIGQLKLEYLICKPVMGLNMSMSTSFQNYWRWERAALDVGHRGMGSTYKHKKMTAVRENTVTSLQSAGSHGADYVEFDVQLSKDMIPVIYHDFHVCITYRKKKRDDLELFRIAVKDLNLSELQSMKLSHVSTMSDTDHDKHTDDLDHDDLQPFPTLQRCFEAVDPNLGFNVEVKYPQEKMDGELEDTNFWDRNKYIDIILRVVFQSAGQRRVVFSSFDPDTVYLLRRKQNKYPVLFLSNGETDRYVPYIDPRTHTVDMAKHTALFSDILGIDVLTDILIKQPELIQSVKQSGLVVFCWGEENNNTETINTLKQNGIDAIIYDKLAVKQKDKENIFQLGKEKKRAILSGLDSGSVEQLGTVSPKLSDSFDSDVSEK